jgi:hypothetical protein
VPTPNAFLVLFLSQIIAGQQVKITTAIRGILEDVRPLRCFV